MFVGGFSGSTTRDIGAITVSYSRALPEGTAAKPEEFAYPLITADKK